MTHSIHPSTFTRTGLALDPFSSQRVRTGPILAAAGAARSSHVLRAAPLMASRLGRDVRMVSALPPFSITDVAGDVQTETMVAGRHSRGQTLLLFSRAT